MGIDLTIRIAVLIVALGMQVCLHSFWFKVPHDSLATRAKILKKSMVGAIGLVAVAHLGGASWRSWLLYQGWKAHPLEKFLLPPYASKSYFLGYVGSRFFLPAAAAIVAALVVGWLAAVLNRRYDERFFEQEEPYFFALSVLCVGYPVFLFFIILMFCFGAAWSASYQFLRRGRAPFYYLWFPVAILAILLASTLIPVSLIASFNF